MQEQPNAKPDGWSEITSGVAGRLRLAFADLKPGLTHVVYLELRNHGQDPVTLTNQPQIGAQVFDSVGKPLTVSGQAGYGPEPVRQLAVIPRDAYIGLRIEMQNLGLPTREHGVVLLALGGKAWELRPGKYSLKASILFEAQHDGPANQWIGKLDLPEVEVVVTSEMVATQ